MLFETEKNGYKKESVDRYIANLELSANKQGEQQRLRISELVSENEKLETKLSAYKNKEDLISKALIDAMARAKKIEENSRKIYDLEIQKIRLLYNKYKSLLDNLIENNSCLEMVDSVTKHTRNFKSSINKVLSSQNERANITQNADAKMRELLTKMNNVVAERNAESQNNKVQNNAFEQTSTHAVNIKPICDINLEKTDKFENLVDKFLETDETNTNAFAKQLLHEEQKSNGFDLSEAVTPTESLEDIMKSFDLDED